MVGIDSMAKELVSVLHGTMTFASVEKTYNDIKTGWAEHSLQLQYLTYEKPGHVQSMGTHKEWIFLQGNLGKLQMMEI